MILEGPVGKVFIMMLGERALSDRGYFMGVVMRASSLRKECNFLYLAVPKVVAPFVDIDVLKEHAIGLLVVEDGEVWEALTSPYRPVEEMAPGGMPLEFPTDLLDRLSKLEKRISRLEQEISALRPLLREVSSLRALGRQVRELSSRVEALSRRLASLPLETRRHAPPEEARVAPASPQQAGVEGLPSFFKDNPWLEILSKRGEEDVPS